MRIRRIIDILNSEARASFSPNGNLRTSCPAAICEGGECRAVVSALQARTSVIFHLQGFSGPPLQNIGTRSAPMYI